jgi:hypothetical protein
MILIYLEVGEAAAAAAVSAAAASLFACSFASSSLFLALSAAVPT